MDLAAYPLSVAQAYDRLTQEDRIVLTHRAARRRLGSRTARRSNTNGKVLNANSKIKPKRRNPLRSAPGKPTNAARVWALVEA
jgi:hypothetical protein